MNPGAAPIATFVVTALPPDLVGLGTVSYEPAEFGTPTVLAPGPVVEWVVTIGAGATIELVANVSGASIPATVSQGDARRPEGLVGHPRSAVVRKPTRPVLCLRRVRCRRRRIGAADHESPRQARPTAGRRLRHGPWSHRRESRRRPLPRPRRRPRPPRRVSRHRSSRRLRRRRRPQLRARPAFHEWPAPPIVGPVPPGGTRCGRCTTAPTRRRAILSR